MAAPKEASVDRYDMTQTPLLPRSAAMSQTRFQTKPKSPSWDPELKKLSTFEIVGLFLLGGAASLLGMSCGGTKADSVAETQANLEKEIQSRPYFSDVQKLSQITGISLNKPNSQEISEARVLAFADVLYDFV